MSPCAYRLSPRLIRKLAIKGSQQTVLWLPTGVIDLFKGSKVGFECCQERSLGIESCGFMQDDPKPLRLAL